MYEVTHSCNSIAQLLIDGRYLCLVVLIAACRIDCSVSWQVVVGCGSKLVAQLLFFRWRFVKQLDFVLLGLFLEL